MDELPYALSEEDFVRMSNAVRRVEGLPPRRDSQAFNRVVPENAPHTWIKVTSATGSTVTLGGGTITGYAAVWGFFDSGGTGFIWTTNVAWYVPPTGSPAPALNQVFECRLLGADTSGVPIWGAANYTAIFSGAQYRNATVQSLATSGARSYSQLTVTGGTQIFDTDNYTQTFIIRAAGYYAGQYTVLFTNSGAAYEAGVQAPTQNSSTQIPEQTAQSTDNIVITVPFISHFASPGSGMAPNAFQTSGANINVQILVWSIYRIALG